MNRFFIDTVETFDDHLANINSASNRKHKKLYTKESEGSKIIFYRIFCIFMLTNRFLNNFALLSQ